MHIPFFRIFYSTTFTVLSIALVLLLLVTPGDGIYQSYSNNHIWNLLIIAAVYFSTFLIAIFIYATRLYTNRTHLASIPRAWILGDVKKSARRMIIESLEQSALIAYDAHPRDLTQEKTLDGDGAQRHTTSNQQNNQTPVWGIISHPGWSSPSSPDLPNLQYEPVLLELPHLIEAKAVSLAPTIPIYLSDTDPSHPSATIPPLPDAAAIELLQRPATMSLRDYLTHLTTLSVLHPPELAGQFLTHYERARFGPTPISESDFRALMAIFASLLRGMKELSPSIIASLHASSDYTSSSSDASSVHSTNTVEHTPFHTPMPFSDGFERTAPRHKASDGSLAGSEGTVRTAPSRQRARPRDGSRGTGSARTGRMPSSASLRQVKTKESVGSAGSGGSVIRLAEAAGPLDLPYAFFPSGEEG